MSFFCITQKRGLKILEKLPKQIHWAMLFSQMFDFLFEYSPLKKCNY